MKNTVEKTIIRKIQCWPDLYNSRSEVLHHLFIVLGCGYEWQKGKLVNKFSHEEIVKISFEEAAEIAKIKTSIERPYPWSKLCNLALLPKDIKPDWKNASEEITEILKAQNYSFVDSLDKS